MRFLCLPVVEMRSLLARRRSKKHVDSKLETRVFATFEEDIRRGFLILHPIPATTAAGAVNLIPTLPDIPLRTLDAMHLTPVPDYGERQAIRCRIR